MILHRHVLCVCGCAGLLWLVGCEPAPPTPVHAEQATPSRQQGFAVVELFTSQGCSSCPAADRNLARIARESVQAGQQVYTLSFHVDYWNYLGWEDPFSSKQASLRQREYARTFQAQRVYTPQMIVNGTTEFVGSRIDESRQAIANALRQSPQATLEITAAAENGAVKVDCQLDGALQDAAVHVALVQQRAWRDVNAGENRGRKLEHIHVVRDFQTVAATQSTVAVKLKLPAGSQADDFRVVAFVQSKDRKVHAAARTAISSQTR